MSSDIRRSEHDSGVDTEQGNWLTRNFWMVKGGLAAAVLVGFAFASLAVFDHEMANVLWAISITLAALLVIGEIAFGLFEAVRSV